MNDKAEVIDTATYEYQNIIQNTDDKYARNQTKIIVRS